MNGSRNNWRVTWLIVGAIALVGVVLAYVMSTAKFEMKVIDYSDDAVEIEVIPPAPGAPATGPLARYATGPLKALRTPAPAPAPDNVFKTASGADIRLADFRGRVVVVNLWAMWCAPCRTEMPTLATLDRAYADDQVVVLPINVDVGAEAPVKARAFIADLQPLPFYADPTFELPFQFDGKGAMPQTIMIDRQGQVRAVLTGGADWSSAEARGLVEALLAEG